MHSVTNHNVDGFHHDKRQTQIEPLINSAASRLINLLLTFDRALINV